ncbi:hypothetical protein Tco_0897318 [Tanacetum coccineum]
MKQLKLPIICKNAENRSKVAVTVLTLTINQPSSSRTWPARIQIEDYADRRNTSVGLFGKLQRVMHYEKERGLSKLPKEVLISSDTNILGQSNRNKKKDIVMEKHATTEAEIGCHIDGVAVVFK